MTLQSNTKQNTTREVRTGEGKTDKNEAAGRPMQNKTKQNTTGEDRTGEAKTRQEKNKAA